MYERGYVNAKKDVVCDFFFFNDTATTEIYTLSLPAALPISCWRSGGVASLNPRLHSGKPPACPESRSLTIFAHSTGIRMSAYDMAIEQQMSSELASHARQPKPVRPQ